MQSPKTWASAATLAVLLAPALAAAQEEDAADTPTADETEVSAEDAAAPEEEPAPAKTSTRGSTSLSAGARFDSNGRSDSESSMESAGAATDEPSSEEEAEVEVNQTVEVEETDDDGKTDHENVVGHLGVGLLGSTSVSTVDAGFNMNDTLLPVVGARYWLSETLGLQAGLGLNHVSGGNDQNTFSEGVVDTPTLWAFAVHVGAPLSLYNDQHYKFIVQPEANFVFATGQTLDNPNIDGDQGVESAAWGVDVGARVGAEVHFGFIGVPKLSLQGSVGAAYTLRQARLETVENGELIERVKTEHGLGTANFNDPWDLFTSSIAAIYYF